MNRQLPLAKRLPQHLAGTKMQRLVGRTAAALAILCAVCGDSTAQTTTERPRTLTVIATGYAIRGVQRAGTQTREGTAAADPEVLPLGTRVRVRGKRGYIGELVITDTGSKVKGRAIDIFFDTRAEAKRFGRQRVQVEVLEWGNGPASARQEVREGITPPAPQ